MPAGSSPHAAVDKSPSLGLTDVVVVDTGDAVLVTTVERAQDVKAVVDALTVGGRPDLT
jgi:mannose-1-phosphate guanylyltransferase